MSVKLSVIIPTYNRAEFLSQCLRSVLASSYENLEVIVSDNASQDNTQALVSSFTDNRLRYHRNNTNIGGVLNILKLLEYATGDYIICLGDDDFLNEGAIDEIINIIQEYPDVGVILHALNRLDATINQPYADYVPYPHSRLFSSGQESLVTLLWVARSFPTIVIRRDLIDIAGARRHMDSMYPQAYMVGNAMKKAPTYYSDKRLVTARLFAKRCWEYENPHHMLLTKIDIVRDLLQDQDEKQCRDILIGGLIRSQIGSVLIQGRHGRIPLKICLKQTLSLLAIPEVRKPRIFWGDFFPGLWITIARTIWAVTLRIKERIDSPSL